MSEDRTLSTPIMAPPAPGRMAWGQVALAAVLMLATLPSRTQGLGLITEPLLRDTGLDRVVYAQINLWATLLGAAFSLPAGWVLDRCGLRWPSVVLLLLLGAVVLTMSVHPGGVVFLFVLVLLTRAFGQSALSVASITVAGRNAGGRSGLAMGVYSVLFSMLFAAAFVGVEVVVKGFGWRVAWGGVAAVLVLGIAPLMIMALRNASRDRAPEMPEETGGLSLWEALRTPAFWIFGGAVALFGLASSGLGLFNESVLAERGFGHQAATFLGVTTLVALIGQFLGGWWCQRWPMPRLLGVAMFLYAGCLATLPLLRTPAQLWVFAGVFGLAAGMIIVLFFAVWGHVFGRAHLGRIQGAAQMLTVFASAVGPLIFAQSREWYHSYAPVLYVLAPLVLLLGVAAWRLKIRPFSEGVAGSISSSSV